MTDPIILPPTSDYTAENFVSLQWHEHIRLRPGMYIGRLGDGTQADDGIYVLLKEVIDNAIDEFAMGNGKAVQITMDEYSVTLRDYGRGIPLEKVFDAAATMNTGAKYDNKGYKKSVGLNGVGLKAVNALSSDFYIRSVREGRAASCHFAAAKLLEQTQEDCNEKNGTLIRFTPDNSLFTGYKFLPEYVERMLKHYSYLNVGLRLYLNGVEFSSKNGLLDLLSDAMAEEPLYPPIHLKGEDIEIALTHGSQNGEFIFSYANGQNTSEGGTHLTAFKEAVVKTVKDFYQKDLEPADIRQAMIGAVSLRLMEPEFGNQPKTLLTSKDMEPGGPSVRSFILDFVKEQLDNYLHKNPQTAETLLKRIQTSEKERKAINDIRKITKAKAKKLSLNNAKLRDCRVHFPDKNPLAPQTQIFITEGDSASGSITKSRDPRFQAVFSLKGKPLNTYGESSRKVFENQELALLHAALNIEDSLDSLRYNKVIIATDADSDGMHIRMLVLTFFLLYYPDLVSQGHVYILQTPLFRVRNKKATRYCYSEAERDRSVQQLGGSPEITRFKGLGEISPDEFKIFIGEDIRLDRVHIESDDKVADILQFYMDDNTPGRRKFIEDNLRLIIS